MMKMLNEKNFWIKVKKTESCWLWTASKTKLGYGMFGVEIEEKVFFTMQSHRIAYRLLKGEIPRKMVIDHTCRVRNCVNPDHLRVVTQKTNVLENSNSLAAFNIHKTHCPKGHAYSDDNLCSNALREGKRSCKKCHAIKSSLRYYSKLRPKHLRESS